MDRRVTGGQITERPIKKGQTLRNVFSSNEGFNDMFNLKLKLDTRLSWFDTTELWFRQQHANISISNSVL